MGQYYRPLLKTENSITIYSRNLIIDGNEEYTMAKLTEHSWIGNWFMETMCNRIYQESSPVRLIWMGDYADDFANNLTSDSFNGISKLAICNYRNSVWCEPDRSIPIERVEFEIYGKYIINHTKKEYLDFSLYYEKNVMDSYGEKWCLHPLSLLTCVGNGYGGGDYNAPTPDSDYELVGYWAWDEISIEDSYPQDYTLINPLFKEKGWESEDDTTGGEN